MGPYSSCETRPIHSFSTKLEGEVKTLRARDVVTLRSEGYATNGDLVTFTVKHLEVDTIKDTRYWPPASSRAVHIVSRSGARYRIGSASWSVVSIEHPVKPLPLLEGSVIRWTNVDPGVSHVAVRARGGSWYTTGRPGSLTEDALRSLIGDREWTVLS